MYAATATEAAEEQEPLAETVEVEWSPGVHDGGCTDGALSREPAGVPPGSGVHTGSTLGFLEPDENQPYSCPFSAEVNVKRAERRIETETVAT